MVAAPEKWVEFMKDYEQLRDWTIRITDEDTLCLHKTKELFVSIRSTTQPYAFLHVAAHAWFRNHDELWGNRFTLLCHEYAEKNKK